MILEIEASSPLADFAGQCIPLKIALDVLEHQRGSREKLQEQKRRYYEENREKLQEQQRRYREENREKHRAYMRDYQRSRRAGGIS